MQWVWRIAACLLIGCSRPERVTAPDPIAAPPTRADVWREIQPRAARYRLSAGLVYALVAAESNFDARAQNGQARGLMQLTPAAWQTVSSKPYEPTVWDWRENVSVGIDYLAHTRGMLHRHGHFSLPLLAAAYHYGLDYVSARKFELRRIPPPDHVVYRRIWAGEVEPIDVPVADSAAPATGGLEP